MTETFDCGSIPCPDRGDVCGACQGHRVTKRIHSVADVLCWASHGHRLAQLEDVTVRGDFFRLALRYIDDLEGA